MIPDYLNRILDDINPSIPDSTSNTFSNSGLRITLHQRRCNAGWMVANFISFVSNPSLLCLLIYLLWLIYIVVFGDHVYCSKVHIVHHVTLRTFCLHYSTGTHKTTMFIYGRVGSQATVPFIQHICRYVQISSNIYKRKNRSTKAGHENPKKPAGGKNTGNVYPRPRQWCNPWGFRVC